MQIRKYKIGIIDNNNYLCFDENSKDAFLIDATANEQRIVDDIKSLGLNLRYIVLTHGHFDHTTGTKFFQANFPEAKLVAGKKESKLLYDRDLSKGPGGIVADIWVKEGDELSCGDITLKFIETPGHTSGGICILCGKVLFSGDTLFQCSVGRTDFPYADHQQLINSIKEKLLVLPEETKVFPGHGMSTTIGHEKNSNQFI